MEILKDEDLEVQVRAFTAIMALDLGADATVRNALSALNEQGCWSDADLPKTIVGDHRKAAHALQIFLAAPDPSQRLAAALALSALGTAAKDCLPVLKKTLSDGDHAVRAAALLAIGAADPKTGTDFTQVSRHVKHAIDNYRGTSDLADLVRVHMLLSTIPTLSFRGRGPEAGVKRSLHESREWVGKTLDDCRVSREELPVLAESINLIARFNLGFTDPFSRLSFKLETVVHQSKDPVQALYVFQALGKEIPADSLYWPAIQEQWLRLLASVPIEFLILGKQQTIQQQSGLILAIEGQQKAFGSAASNTAGGISWQHQAVRNYLDQFS